MKVKLDQRPKRPKIKKNKIEQINCQVLIRKKEEKEKRLDFTDDPGNKLLAVPEVDPHQKNMLK